MKVPAFEIIGSRDGAVAIVEFRNSISNLNKRKIAKEIITRHKNVKSVLAKASARKGKYRKRSYELILGDENTEVLHIENGYRLLVDPQKTYFSPRESTERLRICEMVKKGEDVAIFFAGVGPFAIAIGKKTKAHSVVGIELNPNAVKYFEENIRLNKLKNVKAVNGDVKGAAKKYKNSFDRIVMPLPESSHKFLKQAEMCGKKNAIVHYYCFCREDDGANLTSRMHGRSSERRASARQCVFGTSFHSDVHTPSDLKELIRKTIKRKVRFSGVQKVLPWGPGIYKMRIDFKIV